MRPPVLITAPTDPVVTLADLKLHLRVDHDDDDDLIEAFQSAAVAHLDGWTGVLGRAIMPQVWRQEFDAWGDFRLLMPDASDISVHYCTEETHGHSGEHVYEMITNFVVKTDMRGTLVTATGPTTDNIRVEYTCGMTATQLPAAQALVKLMVGNWYANREAVVVGTITAELPFAADALITAMRWMDF